MQNNTITQKFSPRFASHGVEAKCAWEVPEGASVAFVRMSTLRNTLGQSKLF